ncbi:MAG: RNA polymerase sigma factor [Clostridia bacterium]|nr:RNA polymerase sigma factor [Clostridia bacterium]
MGVFDGAICDAAMKKIAAGDMDGVDIIYKHLGKQIYTLALSILGNETAAEDVMQETFLRIMNSAGTYVPERGGARTWILAVTRNLAIDRERKEHAGLWADLSEDVPAEDVYARIDDADEAERILGALDGTERQIVVLRVVQRLKWKEVAGIIGRSESRTRMIFSDAVGKIRKITGKGKSDEGIQNDTQEV